MSPAATEPFLVAVARAVGVAIVAGTISAAVAVGYRWYVRESVAPSSRFSPA
ncbi:hypothetical protein VB779_01855 [Haloarculaceae archaeon H-GB11]|nr:hypothetical protein [Haloarculaceae archaeon H-GB11]